MEQKVRIIGVCGKARSGKDTFARFLADHLEARCNGVIIMHMADPIRAMIKHVLAGLCPPNEPVSHFTDACYNGDRKELPLTTHNSRTSPRYLMQTLGTDWGRDMIDEKLWLWILERRIDKVVREAAFDIASPTVYIIVPDIRYDNEAEYINDKVYKLVRPNAADVNAHTSEFGISEDHITRSIYNDGDLSALANEARLVAKELDDECC